MSKRKDPVNQVIDFFESASPETAAVVFSIVKSIVARRAPAKSKLRDARAPRPPKAAVNE